MENIFKISDHNLILGRNSMNRSMGANIANGSLVLDTKTPVMTFEGSKLYRVGSLNVVELRGSYRDMGRQYGMLLKNELNEFYINMSTNFGKDPRFTYDAILQTARSDFRFYPQRYKEIIYGLTETSGMGFDKQLIVNNIIKEISIYINSHEKECSGVAAWGNYTSDGQLVFGRNYDLGPEPTKYTTVVVYNPNDGSIPLASINCIGNIGMESGMNKEGIFLELNDGHTSENMPRYDRIPALFSLFSFLENSVDLDQIDAQFHTSYPDIALIVNVANETGAYSYEWATSNVVRRTPDKVGLLVATNHFVDPSWRFAPIALNDQDPVYTAHRRSNLLALGEKYKGKFNPEVMMKIMNIPLEKGGAFRAPNDTSYQIVAVPKELKIWVRMPEVQEWTEVDLKPLFSEK